MIFGAYSIKYTKKAEVRILDANFLFNEKKLNINRLPARASIVPAQKEGIYYTNKEESEFIFSLNGEYDFKYSPDNDPNGDFYSVGLDTGAWNKINVPSVWEYNGYGLPVYPNVEYPFPFDPPYVHGKNPTGCYRKKFVLDKVPERSILHFDGVDDCFEVYINGEFAGCAKNTRIAAEFDVTRHLKKGENLIAVKVYKYSSGSYLENQDMLLASGLQRDVYLINTSAETVDELRIRTDTKKLECTVFLNPDGDYEGFAVCARLGRETQVLPAKQEVKFLFEPENVKLWSAEAPNLYDFTVTLEKCGEKREVHSKKVGFREVRTGGGKLLVNGVPITLKGINRHEYNCKTGRTISVEQIRRELEQIKECNINAIRMSHYPNHPATYEIAAELGIYLMDEADIETHGCGVTGDQGYISKLPSWYDAYFDRISRMYYRDANETAIIIWSPGNEAGRGGNIDRCIEWLRTMDNRPVNHAQDVGDFLQAGYCKAERLDEFPEDSEKPCILTEYAHSMGNGPGTLKEYWQKIYHSPHIAGGFVWEYKNHGFYKKNDDGTEDYLYGGDFGDFNNWSNFTLDGFCFSDGTKKPAMTELKEIYAPVWAEMKDGKVLLTNTNDFINLNEYSIIWRVKEDTKIIKQGTRKIESVPPHESTEFTDYLPVLMNEKGARYMLDLEFVKNGRREAYKQLVIGENAEREKSEPENFEYTVKKCGENVTVTGKDFFLEISGGMISRWECGGKPFIKKMKVNLFRAPTDNDGIVGLYPRHIDEWNSVFLDKAEFFYTKSEIKEERNSVKITFIGKVLPPARFAGFFSKIEYTVFAHGLILVSWEGEPYGNLPDVLPRIGMEYTVDKSFSETVWYGRGQGENYCDRLVSTPIGLYEGSVKDMNVNYEVPQENGNRENCRYAAIKNGGFAVVGVPEFAFSLHGCSLENLTAARHRSEVKEAENNFLYVDYKMRGLGSRSCGPDPEEQYELHPHRFVFAHLLVPETDERVLLALSKKDFGIKTAALSGKYEKPEDVKMRESFECRE